jgi:glycine/D-amino acid oxidase-like deaminating enzyme
MHDAAGPPRSLWTETAPLPPPTAPLAGRVQADVAIVGGGYTGLAAAHDLAEAGLSAVVLEARELGHGGSGRNGGVVSAKFRVGFAAIERAHGFDVAQRMHVIAHESVQAVEHLVERYGIAAAEYRRSGALKCAHNAAAFAGLEAEAAWLRDRLGDGSARILDRQAVAAETGSRAFQGGLLFPHSGTIRPLAYLRGLAAGLIARGVAVHTQSPALAIEPCGNRIGVVTPEGRVEAGQAILATGAYSDLTPLTDRLRRTMVPFRSAIIATDVLPPELDRRLLPQARSYTETRRMMRWFRKVDGRVIFGGRGALGPVDAPRAFERLHKAMTAIFPELSEVPVGHRWSGHVSLTLDALPHCGRLDDGVVFAAGYNGAGVAMASLLGAKAARIARGETPELALLRRDRLRPIPLYGMCAAAVRAVTAWHEAMDAIGR